MLIAICVCAIALRSFNGTSLFWLCIWPGTALHEILHWIVGKCLGASPTHFSLIPREKYGDRVLGSVTFENITWWNSLPIGLAPLLAIPVVLSIALNLHLELNWKGGLILWGLSSALSQCIPSEPDRRIAFAHCRGLFLWGSLGLLSVKVLIG